jgi:pilus assembly protein CpaE
MPAVEAIAPPPPSNSGWVAVVSSDPEVPATFWRILDDPELPLSLSLAIDSPLNAIDDADLKELRRSHPDVVVVDLSSDPAAGLRLVRSLVGSGDVGALLAIGSDFTQELLLEAIQAGVVEVLTKPLDPAHVRTALQRVHRRADRGTRGEGASSPGRVLALVGAKGGVGTTALATNLAVEIHRRTGGRTLLLDLDVEQGETALFLGMEPRFSLLDLLRHFQPTVSGLLAACIDHHEESGIDLLAAPAQAQLVQPDEFRLLSAENLRPVLEFLREHYDWIVIDRPRSFHPAFSAILEQADETYLVTTPDLQALRNITRSLPLLRQAGGKDKKGQIRMIVNRYPVNAPITLQEIEETVGMDVFHALGADFFPLNESIHEGQPLVLTESSQFASDIRALAELITGGAPEPKARKGLLSGLLHAVRRGR